MKIPLSEFEHFISETILDRGLSYFKNGAVDEFWEISNGEFEAVVWGTEPYTVCLKVVDDIIVEHRCDCPYDWGPVCKHVAAVIFYMKQDELGLSQEKILPAGKPKKKKRRKSVAQQVKEILDKVSHEDLKKFIQEQCKRDKQFRSLFLSGFAHLNEGQSKAFYRQQVRLLVNSLAGRHGFIDWHQMKLLRKRLGPIIDLAAKQFKNKNYKNAIAICTALIEEMEEVINACDDSDGYASSVIEHAFTILRDIAGRKIPGEVRKKLFDYCIASFKKDMFKGWDWHVGILELAFELATHEDEADTIISCLNTIDGKYERNIARAFQLEVISKFKDAEEVRKFMNDHIGNFSIRKAAIKKAMADENFEEAIKLCKAGIKYDKKERPGFVKTWYDWLLKIAQAQNDREKIIEYARFLFIDNFSAEQDYYQILKQEVGQNAWNDFLEDMIKDINAKGNWGDKDLLRQIYIREKWWDRLLSLLKESPSLLNIEIYEEYLAKTYPQELVELYAACLVNYLDWNTGRKHYQTVCRYLRRMKKLGGTEKVNELIEYFKETYPKRRALMEELDGV